MARKPAAKAVAEPPPPAAGLSVGSKADMLVMVTAPSGATAESIKALRTRIFSQHVETGARALALCGPAPEVGCTFTAANLAVAFAQVGVKTLLIDCDMRNASLQAYFAREDETGGLHACLTSGEGAAIDYIQADVYPGLDVLFAGQNDMAAQELLSAERFSDVINGCLRDYDLTIADTPPANACADSRRVSTVLGFGLIIARKHHSLMSDIRVLSEQLQKERAVVVGTVLNAF